MKQKLQYNLNLKDNLIREIIVCDFLISLE